MNANWMAAEALRLRPNLRNSIRNDAGKPACNDIGQSRMEAEIST
jgi:hypothetical protein